MPSIIARYQRPRRVVNSGELTRLFLSLQTSNSSRNSRKDGKEKKGKEKKKRNKNFKFRKETSLVKVCNKSGKAFPWTNETPYPFSFQSRPHYNISNDRRQVSRWRERGINQLPFRGGASLRFLNAIDRSIDRSVQRLQGNVRLLPPRPSIMCYPSSATPSERRTPLLPFVSGRRISIRPDIARGLACRSSSSMIWIPTKSSFVRLSNANSSFAIFLFFFFFL